MIEHRIFRIIVAITTVFMVIGCAAGPRPARHTKASDVKMKSYASGKEAYKKGDYGKALRLFKTLVQSEPSNWNFHNWTAWTYYRLNDYDLACESFEKSIRLSPRVSNLEGMGRSFYAKQDFQNSIYYFRRAIEIDRENGNLYHWLGMNYLKLQNYDKGIENFKKSNHFSKLPANYQGLGQAYLAKKEYENSLYYFRRYAELEPGNNYPYAGFVYLAKGDFVKATSAFKNKKILGSEIKSDPRGILIMSAHVNAPASVAGLKPGDIITNFNNHSLQGLSVREFLAKIQQSNWGDTVPITFQRGNQIQQSEIIIGITDKLITKITGGHQRRIVDFTDDRVNPTDEPITRKPPATQEVVTEDYELK